jgi:acyl-coenzyme A synthetase/AMP-(fatty) acid ligase
MGLRVWAAKPSATLSVLSAAVDRPDVQVLTGLPFHLDLILGSSSTDVFSRLAAVMSSAGKLHSETIEQSLTASLPLFNIYGSTETGTLAVGDMRSVSDPLGYVGRPLPDVEIRLATSPDSDEDVLHVRTGGLADGVIRGSHYDDRLAVDGWFPTSDIARVEPKGIWLVGRQADFLKVAGVRVSCSRIREVLLRYSGVADVEVFGVEDKVRGEVPACRVVLNSGVSVESLRTWCAAELSPVEIPRFIESVDHIPRSATGKIMRWS